MVTPGRTKFKTQFIGQLFSQLSINVKVTIKINEHEWHLDLTLQIKQQHRLQNSFCLRDFLLSCLTLKTLEFCWISEKPMVSSVTTMFFQKSQIEIGNRFVFRSENQNLSTSNFSTLRTPFEVCYNLLPKPYMPLSPILAELKLALRN